jgi:hypothetical protein
VGGVGLGANSVVITNGLSTLTSLNCPTNQVIKFGPSGNADCGIDSAPTGNEFVNGGNTFGAPVFLGTNDNYALNFETNGQNRISVANNGNVGVGTTAPNFRLDVSGGTLTTSGTLGPDASAISIKNLISTTSGSPSLINIGPDVGSNSVSGILSAVKITTPVIGAGGLINSYVGLDIENAAATNFNIGLKLNQNDGTNNYSLFSSGSAKSHFNGNVGIKTTSPIAALDVNGPVKLGQQSSTLNRMIFCSNITVSIGTNISPGNSTVFTSAAATPCNGTISGMIMNCNFVSSTISQPFAWEPAVVNTDNRIRLRVTNISNVGNITSGNEIVVSCVGFI